MELPPQVKNPVPIAIRGAGYYLPDRVLTNADLEKMVETSDEWITERTGIKERRVADPAMSTSDMAICAAKRALANANMQPGEIDMIICATVSRFRWPWSMRVNRARLVFSQSCSSLRCVVSFKVLII